LIDEADREELSRYGTVTDQEEDSGERAESKAVKPVGKLRRG